MINAIGKSRVVLIWPDLVRPQFENTRRTGTRNPELGTFVAFAFTNYGKNATPPYFPLVSVVILGWGVLNNPNNPTNYLSDKQSPSPPVSVSL